MASKNITIKEDSYKRLKSMKRPDESFSDLIDRLTEEKTDIRAGFGLFSPEAESEKTFSETVAEERERMNEEFESREDSVFE